GGSSPLGRAFCSADLYGRPADDQHRHYTERRRKTVDDTALMRRALELAQIAGTRGDVPVGAVVAIGGEIASVGFNQKEANNDPTAHAENVAVRQAAARQRGWRLDNATLYVTKEPCVMCAGACVAAR